MKKKILLIDDSKTQLQTLKILLSRYEFDIEIAYDGVEGYQKIFETAPDAIISDIMMPNLNGYLFCRLVKDNPITKDIPIILLTMLEQKIDKFWSKKSGADRFLLKSSDVDSIINTLREVIDKKPVSEEQKEKIKTLPVSQGMIQAEINQILDSSLMHASILNDFRLLSMHIEDDNEMAKNLFELLSSVLNFNLALLVINPPTLSEKEIYASSCLNFENPVIKKAVKDNIANIFGAEFDYTVKSVYDTNDVENIDEIIFQNVYTHRIEHQGNIVGAISFFCTLDKDIINQKLLHIILKEIDLLITIQALYAQNKFLSLTDSLTGLYNRRYLMETLEREHQRALRYNANMAIALIDIDFFKKINDNYGHQAGDFILKEITGIIRKKLRKSDIIFRYGGEEMLVIMPETSSEKAQIPLERLREFIANSSFNYQDKEIKATISAGITDLSQKTKTLELFIEYADKAMYQSKQTGRNKVTIYNE